MSRTATTGQNTSDASYTASVEVVSYTAPAPAPNHTIKLLIDFGEHAREFVSSEVGLRLLQLLADESKLDAQLQRSFSAAEASRVKQLLSCCVDMRVCPLHMFTAFRCLGLAVRILPASAHARARCIARAVTPLARRATAS